MQDKLYQVITSHVNSNNGIWYNPPSLWIPLHLQYDSVILIARFMGLIWGPPGAERTQVGPMLAPWTLLSGLWIKSNLYGRLINVLWEYPIAGTSESHQICCEIDIASDVIIQHAQCIHNRIPKTDRCQMLLPFGAQSLFKSVVFDLDRQNSISFSSADGKPSLWFIRPCHFLALDSDKDDQNALVGNRPPHQLIPWTYRLCMCDVYEFIFQVVPA